MNLYTLVKTEKSEGIQKSIILQTSYQHCPFVFSMREGSCADNGSLMPSEEVSFLILKIFLHMDTLLLLPQPNHFLLVVGLLSIWYKNIKQTKQHFRVTQVGTQKLAIVVTFWESVFTQHCQIVKHYSDKFSLRISQLATGTKHSERASSQILNQHCTFFREDQDPGAGRGDGGGGPGDGRPHPGDHPRGLRRVHRPHHRAPPQDHPRQHKDTRPGMDCKDTPMFNGHF